MPYVNILKPLLEDEFAKPHGECKFYQRGFCNLKQKNCVGSLDCGDHWESRRSNTYKQIHYDSYRKISRNINTHKAVNDIEPITISIYTLVSTRSAKVYHCYISKRDYSSLSLKNYIRLDPNGINAKNVISSHVGDIITIGSKTLKKQSVVNEIFKF